MFRLSFVFVASIAAAAVIDRIAVTVGDSIITRSDIEVQVRVAALLDGRPVSLTPDDLRQAADRLIEQTLIRREIALGDYPVPTTDMVERVLKSAKRDRLGGEPAAQRAMAAYGIIESQLRQQLEWQLTLLRFIDQRFRTGVQIPAEDAVAYYRETFAPDWRKQRQSDPPPFPAAREEIERILTEQQVSSLVDRWLSVARTQIEIRYREAAFEATP